ncbi:hypothetical protein HYX70_03825 [Candidatus Saccharibacteria bacterium]|nr:hypothetical protein [Candidatus Saccharibacteria bacterium]
MSVVQHEKRLRSAILDLLSYFAVFELPLSAGQIYQYLPVKTTPVAVRVHLSKLIKRGKLQAIDDRYGLRGVNYNKLQAFAANQPRLLKKAKRWSRVFAALPFVKSVVLVSSVAYGCPTEDSDIDMVVVTSPNRIYLTKAYLYGLFHRFDIDSSKQKQNRLGISALFSTNGVKFERDVYGLDPQRLPWLLTAQPLYGAHTWYELLKNNSFVRQNAPNYSWPESNVKLGYMSLSWLDKLDNYAYKRYLRKVSQNPMYREKRAFVRVRPDIIVINAHHGEYLQAKQDRYDQIRAGAA